MATNFTYPGVYIQERPSGLRAIPSAATSIALFVGMADVGPMRSPTRVQSLAEFQRTFGAQSAGEMCDQVAQFFINGGGDAYVLRIAQGDVQASVNLRRVGVVTSVIKVTARDSGKAGNNLRVIVDYATSSPERTFNLTAFRGSQNTDGSFARSDNEQFSDLSMDPASARYFANVINGASKLITVSDLGATAGSAEGISIGGVVYNTKATSGESELAAAITPTANAFSVGVNNLPPVLAIVDTTGLTNANVLARIGAAITNAVASAHSVTPTITVDLDDFAGGGVLRIRSSNGPVVISPAAANDLAAKLQLGIASGGLEFDNFAKTRPAPSGIFSVLGSQTGTAGVGWLAALDSFALAVRNTLAAFELTDPGASSLVTAGTVTLAGTAGNPLVRGTTPVAGAIGSLAYVRQALADIALAVGTGASSRWLAEVHGLRLTLKLRDQYNPANGAGISLKTGTGAPIGAGYNLGGAGNMMDPVTVTNTAAYLVGTTGGSYQTGQLPGNDGTKPTLTRYQEAFNIAETGIEIFNMLILPRADGQTDTDRKGIWGSASAFAASQRAILFVDPESTWTDIATASVGANTIKAGVDTRNSVVFWPQLLVPTADLPAGKKVDPSGSLAGLYARTDSRFGTWTAPAGLEATLTGVIGVSAPMNDPQNGQINIKALNAIRNFPSGITSWGARMMVGADDTGNMDDRYVNVRRMMLFIENSLYRGLRFATFKNNAEPLWASMRGAADSFMRGLMLQDAFASRTKAQAYYVQCDETINPPDDVAKGIVKIVVGFAPNRPAEFVEITVTQIALPAAA